MTKAEKRKAKRAKRLAAKEAPEEPRPPAKAPRPPFLSLSENDSLAVKVLSKGKKRTLAALPQRGPFGDGETTTVLFTEPGEEEDTRVLGGVVVDGGTAHVLPIDNTNLLASDPEVVWASGEHGWQIVVLQQRTQDDAPVQANQAFIWDGQGFVRDAVAEKRVGTMTSPSAIRQALL